MLDDATSELILLMSGQRVLLDYVKNQNSSDEIESKVAARALEVAAFSRDLHQADLAGAIVSHSHLRNSDLSNGDLANSSWLDASFGRVSFDHASLRGVRFRNVTFVDVTFRHVDLSDSRFEENISFYLNILAGVWCTRGDEEILLVVLIDGRIVAITPETLVAHSSAISNLNDQGLTSERLASWLVQQSGTLDLGDLGHVSLEGNWWHRDIDWTKRELAPGLKAQFSDSYAAGGDVEVLDIEVTVEATNQALLKLKLHDTTDFSSAKTVLRAMSISKDGKQAAVVHGNFDEVEMASIRSRGPVENIPLRDFRGLKLKRELSHTTDNRGAAFSPSGKILAIRELQNVVGFWRTDDGECIGRVVFHPAAHGSVLEGAVGLPPEFALSNSGENDGWIVEPPGRTEALIPDL